MSGACTACASVGLPPCFGEAGCAYKVSLTRPTGIKAPRRPGMPETRKLIAASTESQKVGEFLEWLGESEGLVLAAWAPGPGGFGDDVLERHPETTERLLARYYNIDLDRVDRERRRLLAWMRKRGDA